MKIFILAFSIIVLSHNKAFSQVNEEWIARHNITNGNESLVRDMTVDMLGNVYITGTGPVHSHGNDVITVKYNSTGVKEWETYYNGLSNLNDAGHCIEVDADGNVFVGGSSYGSSALSDFLTVKYSPGGIEQWVRFYDGPGHLDDGIKDIETDRFGNVYVTGGSWGLPGAFGTQLDFASIKYSNDGTQQWVKRYNGGLSTSDESFNLVIDSEDNLIVSGYSVETAYRAEDFTTIKYDPSGNMLWRSLYNGPGTYSDQATAMVIDKYDNLYVGGFVTTNLGGYDFAAVKYNSFGNENWSAVYDGNASWDYLNSIAYDTSGNVYVSGVSNDTNNVEDFLTLKYDSTGNLQWSRRYNNDFNGADRLEEMIADRSGNVYVTGYTLGALFSFYFTTIKYNSSGQVQWMKQFHEKRNSCEYGKAIALDAIGNVYVSGYTFGSMPDDEFVTIKYSQTSLVSNSGANLPAEFSLDQNFPNPFNPVTFIDYKINSGITDVKLFVHNALGKRVSTLVNQKQRAGNYSVRFDGINLPSGVYYYQLNAGDFSETKKMILLK